MRKAAHSIFLGVFVAAFIFLGQSSLMSAEESLPYAKDEILVRYQPGTSSSEIRQLRRSINAEQIEKFNINNVHQYKLPEGMSVEEALTLLKKSSKVRYVEPNFIVQISQTPNDPSFSSLYGLNNTGQTGGTSDADIDAPEAWNVQTGDPNFVIAVIDTGVDYTHPDLAANMWTNPGEIAGNGMDDDGNGYIDDIHGWDFANDDNDPMDDHYHGTHCAGTIAGVGNNGIGVSGVVWRAKIMALKFLSSSGSGYISDAISCLNYATQMGAKISSNSWGGGGFSQAMYDAMVVNRNAGALFIAAAGNSAADADVSPMYPAAYDVANVISVAATDANDQLASFSNYGATTVDLGAPGVNIYSTKPGNQYGSLSGTSMACPHVSGAAALMWSQLPNSTYTQIRDRILSTVDPASALSGKTVTGGRLNIYNFMDNDSTAPGAISTVAVQSSSFFSVVLSWTATGDDGTTGTASSYDLRYATSAITESTWSSATQVTGLSAPKASGQTETVKVKGLAANTTYYFALKVRDNVGNASALSNVVSSKTTQGTAIFSENFENGQSMWSLSGTDGGGGNTLWHLSSKRSLSATQSFYYGSETTSNYDTGYENNGSLISSPIFLTNATSSTLIFNHYLTTENYAPYDEASVQVSQNGGSTWTTVYKSYSTNAKWEKVTIDLSDYDGETVLIRFYFDTLDDYYNTFEGWFVDDIQILAEGSADVTPPSDIINLAASTTGLSSVTLTWTAPGDDEAVGKAAIYDLRYSTSTITASNFSSATQVSGLLAPTTSGSAETFEVTGLSTGVTYYFAMKAKDDLYNVSGLSNVISAKTKVGPKMNVTPSSLSKVALDVGATTSQTLTIQNTGDSDLSFEISEGASVSSSSTGAPDPAKINTSTKVAPYLPGQILVKFKEGVSAGALRDLAQGLDARVVKTHAEIGVHLIETASNMDAARLAKSYVASGLVEYAEPNYIVSVNATPNDPSFSSLYGLHNTGQTGGTSDADIDAPEAWDITKGSSNIVVAVIDTGVDYNHPDLAANMWTNSGEIANNGIDDDGNGYVDDIRGWDFVNEDKDPYDDNKHGTHCAGTIGAVGNNGVGVAGVSWTVKIMPLKFLSASGSGSTSDAVSAVLYAANKGAKILSNSWGGGGYSQALYDSIVVANSKGALFVAAAGNNGTNNDQTPHYPSNYQVANVISVAATDNKDLLASFSCFGATTVHLGAPGVNIYSTLPSNTYGSLSGTSMATPHVAGACALIWAANPSWTYAKVKSQILSGTDKVSSLSGKTISGGRLNVHKAMQNAETTPPSAVSTLTSETLSFSTVKLKWTATGDDGNTGTATSYEIRYSTSAINSSNFSSATLVSSVPAPKSSGSAESLTITGLTQKTVYYFAMKVTDDVGNVSGLSNVASATTGEAVALYNNDCENASGWTATGLWHSSTRRYSSATHAFYYGSESTGNYETGAINKGTLTSPEIDLTSGTTPQLSFKFWRTVEYYPSVPGDKTYLEISSNAGSSWALLWYKDGANVSESAWTSSGSLDLTAYKGKKVILRFTFDTVDAYLNAYEGFYIDDIQVLDNKTDFAWFSVQPVTGTVVASSSANISVQYTGVNISSGSYKATLNIKSNDGANPSVQIPVELVVTQDATAPATISDLRMTSLSSSSITLAWTAPGDDGSIGTASSYNMRYSASPITSSNFSSATVISNSPQPKAAGGSESLSISGLNFSSTEYYFAIKTTDNMGNVSLISNVISSYSLDSDGDGLSDGSELKSGTNPNVTDSDGDGMNDLYESIAGTNPLNASSVSAYLFKDDFNDGNTNGWSASGATNNIVWSATTNALVSRAVGSGGYGFITTSLNLASVNNFVISYDVTFSSDSDGWGGVVINKHLDVNAYRSGWRDGPYEGLSGTYKWYAGMSKGVKHRVLIFIKKGSPYYTSDLYIDSKPIFLNESIEVANLTPNTIGFASNYSQNGTVTCDNFTVYSISTSLLLPFSDNFNSSDYGLWISGGNSKVIWDFASGSLRSTIQAQDSGIGIGSFKHALLDVSGKDVIVEFDITPQSSGAFIYRGVSLELNTTAIGWKDSSYQPFSGMSSGASHHVILMIEKTNSYDLSKLYVDNTLIFQNEPIQIASYSDKTVGFTSNLYTGNVLWDNTSVTAVSVGTNLAPLMNSIGDKSVKVGQPLSFQVRAIDLNGDNLVYTATGLPVGATLNPSTGAFNWATKETDAGTYNVTVQVSDGSLTDSETIVISATQTASTPGAVFQENFDTASLSGWVETGVTGNVDWTVNGGSLQCKVIGSGGYSFLDNTSVNLSSLDSFSIEYDVIFNNTDGWGGFRVGSSGKMVGLDINPNRCGWRDGSYEGYSGSYKWFTGISKNVLHHVIISIRKASPYYLSDLHVDGKAVFINEPIEASGLSVSNFGFLSHYYLGNSYSIDGILAKDTTQPATPGTVLASYDFSSNLNNWTTSGAVNNVNWSIASGALTATVIGSGGYCFIQSAGLNIAGKTITVDYDVTFSSNSDGWGQFLYRGIGIDICPNRYGARDGVYEGFSGTYKWYPSTLTKGSSHHVKIKFKPASPYVLMDLTINGNAIFENEVVECGTFPSNFIGFGSGYYSGSVSVDNVVVTE